MAGAALRGARTRWAAIRTLLRVYDINALSNFVTDAETLVGFDPHARFARWLGARARADLAMAAAK